jgi:high affinity sulfate transporter 1
LKISFFPTLKNYKAEYLKNDILAGIIIAALSIPISMGYAQIAGLPAVYGLYGSVLPILIFAMFSTSPQFIFGVDAAPAAMVGSVLITMGVEGDKALSVVPVITFFTACWLLLFFILKAGKLVGYISTPVMGGFISGICCEIILMQVPKLFASPAGTGEVFELIEKIIEAVKGTNMLSPVLGFGTLIIMLICKKYLPKLPMPVIMMVAGGIVGVAFHPEKYGVVMLSAVQRGLPQISMPDFSAADTMQCIKASLPVALVIMCETLLAENNFAQRGGYKLRDNIEILAFALGNFSAAFTGCCPINGSVSRTSVNNSYGGKTQLTSVVAGVLMVFVLLFCTDFIAYLPVPVLTAIVIYALMGVVEVHLAKRLWKANRDEFAIFMVAFACVLLLGTIYGVGIGLVLSFLSIIIKAVDPPRAFLGCIPNQKGFFNLQRNHNAREIRGVVLYRFSGKLFFANVDRFINDIEESIEPDTKCIIVDAGGITDIDITAGDRLDLLYKSLTKRGIKFYITEHIESVNDQLRRGGWGHLITDGVTRRTISRALGCIGMEYPYELSDKYHKGVSSDEQDVRLKEFEWAFGTDAQAQLEKYTQSAIDNLPDEDGVITITDGNDALENLDTFDADAVLSQMELHLSEIAKKQNMRRRDVVKKLEFKRYRIAKQLYKKNPDMFKKFFENHKEMEKALFEANPEKKEQIVKYRKKLIEQVREYDEQMAETIENWYEF